MGSCCEEDEKQFYDAQDDIVVFSDIDSNFPENDVSHSGSDLGSRSSNSSQFDIWVQNPLSIQERRSKFFSWLGFSASKTSYGENLDGSSCSDVEVDKMPRSNEAMLNSLSFEHTFSSRTSFMSSWSGHDSEFYGDSAIKENFLCRIRSWNAGGECIEDELREDGQFGETKGVDSETSCVIEHFELSAGLLPPSREVLGDGNIDASHLRSSKKSLKKWWSRRLHRFSCVMEEKQKQSENSDLLPGARHHIVKARLCSKKHRELSALYLSQDFQAHEGSILVMKFSPDGQYLASAGEDRIVRVWKVVEDERSNEVGISYIDPLHLYFMMNDQLELRPLYAEKESMGKSKSWSRSSGSACVILPPKSFKLFEKPCHEFKGHHGEILDLSWSSSNCLLSSSVDKTVRLWRVGYDHCLKVFLHNNYVACVQFNPIDDDYFISGSIDGKVRIWEISGGQVASWTEIKDIVTAVCYHPDGQGGLVGSISGFCRFYNISDNQFQLDGEICLCNKKKSYGKRIIGFQYFPQDSSKVMVTCADSQINILKGMDVIGKYKGLRGSGNYLSASLTSDGKHIVSACEDSNVYLWNCANHDNQYHSHSKKVKSCEWFPSTASLAIPWNGFQNVNVGNKCPFGLPSERMTNALLLPSPALFSLEQESFMEHNYPKGSQTWPEENLPASARLGLFSIMHKSEHKFLRACQSISSPNVWGLVILTAGWDGRIRSFHNYGLPVPH